MDTHNLEKPASIALIIPFLISGLSKINVYSSSFAFDVKRMPLISDTPFAMIIVFLAGIWEIVASSTIINDVLFDEDTHERLSGKSEIACVSLIVFTVIATLLFYVFPKLKFRALASNISTVAGLLFLLQIVQRNKILEQVKWGDEKLKYTDESLGQKAD